MSLRRLKLPIYEVITPRGEGEEEELKKDVYSDNHTEHKDNMYHTTFRV
jgi:hypothetical protein